MASTGSTPGVPHRAPNESESVVFVNINKVKSAKQNQDIYTMALFTCVGIIAYGKPAPDGTNKVLAHFSANDILKLNKLEDFERQLANSRIIPTAIVASLPSRSLYNCVPDAQLEPGAAMTSGQPVDQSIKQQIAEQKRMWTQIIADQNQRVEYFVRTLGNKHEASVRVIEREKTLGTCMGAAPWPLETIYATRSPNGKVFVDGKLVGTIPDPIPGFISTSSGGRDATPGSGSYGGGSYDYTPGIQSGQLSNIGASYLKTGMGGEYGGAGTPGGYSNSQRGSSNNQGGRGGRLVPDKAVVPAATNKVTATKATKKPGASNDLAAGLANLKLAPSHSPGSAKAKPLSPVANGASGSAALAKKIPPEASKGAASGSAKVSAAGSSASSSKKIRP